MRTSLGKRETISLTVSRFFPHRNPSSEFRYYTRTHCKIPPYVCVSISISTTIVHQCQDEPIIVIWNCVYHLIGILYLFCEWNVFGPILTESRSPAVYSNFSPPLPKISYPLFASVLRYRKDAFSKSSRRADFSHGWQEIGKTIDALTISGICTG